MTGFCMRSKIFFASSKLEATPHFGIGKSCFSQVFLKMALSSIVASASWLTHFGRGSPEKTMIFFLRVPGIIFRTI